MRIQRLRIRSFGGIRDRDYRTAPGMTVFYGPNESGKTSTMEFIRDVLSPDNKRNKYPARGKTDDGTLDYEEDGSVHSVSLSGKDVTGTPPECMKGMDPDLYRKIFSMDAKALDDSDAITQGDVKTRFLTVPGAEGMPGTLSWVEKEEREVLGLRSNSKSKLNDVNSNIAGSTAAIADMKSRASEYGELAAERDGLLEKKKELKEAGTADAEARSVYENYQRNKDNFDRLATMKAERQSLGEFKPVTDDDLGKRAELLAAVETARREKEGLESEKSSVRMRLGGADPRKAESLSQEIRDMPGRLSAYRGDREKLSGMRGEPAPVRQEKRGGSKAGAVIGLIVIVLGAVLGVAVHPAAFALSAVGAVMTAFALKGGRSAPAVQPQDDGRRAELEKRVSDFEKDLRTLCAELDVQSRNPEYAVNELTGLAEAAASLKAIEQKVIVSRARFSEANGNLLTFYQPYAGAEGFEAARAKTLRKADLDRRIESVETAIRSSGLDPASPECPVQWEASGNDDALAEIGRRIGETELRMKGILSMEDLEAEMDRLEGLRSRKSDIIRRGAVAMLAKKMIDDACDRAYDTVSPGVVVSADGFLRSMTGGRYSMKVDLMTGDIRLRSEDEEKDMAKWSSGLRAQALLSIKMAIAKEMGGERIPMILDDVLLPFDSERKAGAVKALSEASCGMQVLLFTCDAETAELAEGTDGVSVLRM